MACHDAIAASRRLGADNTRSQSRCGALRERRSARRAACSRTGTDSGPTTQTIRVVPGPLARTTCVRSSARPSPRLVARSSRAGTWKPRAPATSLRRVWGSSWAKSWAHAAARMRQRADPAPAVRHPFNAGATKSTPFPCTPSLSHLRILTNLRSASRGGRPGWGTRQIPSPAMPIRETTPARRSFPRKRQPEPLSS